MNKGDIITRFWNNVEIVSVCSRKRYKTALGIGCFSTYVNMPKNACWIWKGSKADGYGMLWYKGRLRGAHVVSYLLHRGSIPKGKEICHRCSGKDRRDCVNPAHLYAGTRKQNVADGLRKGTMLLGKRNGSTKLSKTDVLNIRRRVYLGEMQMEIAEDFGVTAACISNIMARRSWGWL